MPDGKHVRAEVTERRDIANELWVVRLRPEAKIGFLPGQYITVGVPGEKRMVERPYSVASAPGDRELEFFLELVPEGQLSPQLYDVPMGGEVFVRPSAKGRLLFDQDSGRRKHLMFATVTGVAPFVSIVRDLIDRAGRGEPVAHELALVQAASVSTEFGYLEELQEYARRCEWFRYIPSVSRPWFDTAWTGEVGRVEDLARKYLDNLGFNPENSVAYLCGNPSMIENMRGVLQRAGFEKQHVKEESYWVVAK